MPAIIINSLELTDKQKEVIAEKYTEIFSELTNVPKDRIYVFFDGYKLNSAAVNGTLFSQKPPATARGEFNRDEWEEK